VKVKQNIYPTLAKEDSYLSPPKTNLRRESSKKEILTRNNEKLFDQVE
jgi:hypothetical protein